MLEARVDRLEAALERLAAAEVRSEERIEALAAAQARTGEQLAALTARVDALAEAQARTEEQLAALIEQVAQLVEALRRAVARLDRLDTRVGDVTGWVLELRYRERAATCFDDILRRIHPLSGEELVALLDEAENRGAIAAVERRDLRQADVVARGRERETGAPTYLVAEVSAVVDEHDVWRAARRAELPGRAAGAVAIPVVAGEQVSRHAVELCRNQGVWRVLDGPALDPRDPQEPAGA